MQSTPDRRLIERAKQGDAGAFEAVLAPVIDAAHRYACALLHDSDLAEDAVQEACVRAWRKLGRLRPGSAFLPWFLGIVARQCRDQMRGQWWRTVLTSQANPSESALAEETALRRVELREALMKLNERERQVLILRLYLDLPWSDVAAVAGVTEAGARTRYYRALERLRPLLGSREVPT